MQVVTMEIPEADAQVSDGTMVTTTFDYKNHRGEQATRQVLVRGVWYGSTKWHPEQQHFIRAWDLEKKAYRDFALRDIMNVRY